MKTKYHLHVKTMSKKVAKELIRKHEFVSSPEIVALVAQAFMAGVLIGGNNPNMHSESIEWFNNLNKVKS